MKRIAVRLFLCMLAILLAATVSLAAPTDGTSSGEPVKMTSKKPRKKSSAKKNLVDINSATAEQLATLPGLSKEDAKQIIAGRPYTRKNQLKQKNILSAATYDGINKLIVAKRQKK
ncbi:MAG: helix-hairpin-helix domain-containing protein [Geobacteraceae bacterium]|nr:helix-hairpin-helix domain-containing protein [Geobacteraceae bacterium]